MKYRLDRSGSAVTSSLLLILIAPLKVMSFMVCTRCCVSFQVCRCRRNSILSVTSQNCRLYYCLHRLCLVCFRETVVVFGTVVKSEFWL